LAHVLHFQPNIAGKKEGAMRRDVLTMTGVSLAAALMAWILWGNPEEAAHSARHMQTAQWIKPDPELKRISEQSPYMRSER
jgi:hypothetical protein